MVSGRVKRVSKLEDTVAATLDILGVRYARQAPIRCTTTGRYVACVDFLLADGRPLEVNGTYWHADPRAYPNGPLHASQKHTAEKYNAKMKKLEMQGISVLEVWELDVDADALGAVKRAIGGGQ